MPMQLGFSLLANELTKKLTKKLTLIFLIFTAFSVVAYQLYFFIQPGVTVTNSSEHLIEKSSVALPNSHLNFGIIAPSNSNTIYYALEQQDGSYVYQFILAEPLAPTVENVHLAGECGYVTHSEYHKRVVITVTADLSVHCEFN